MANFSKRTPQMASVNIDKLLSLPQKERRKIAERLFDSLSPNLAVVRLSKMEEAIIAKRWEDYVAGKVKFSSARQMHQKVFGKK